MANAHTIDATDNIMLLPLEVALKEVMEGMYMQTAKFHDGSLIESEIHGVGPTLLLPVNPQPVTGPQAEAMLQYGTDPALGPSLIKGLSTPFAWWPLTMKASASISPSQTR